MSASLQGNLPSTRPDLTPEAGMLLQWLASTRDALARRIVQESFGIAEPDLNLAITSFLFRLLFLSAGERCGYVNSGTLRLLSESEGIQKRMGRACSDAGFHETMVERALPGKDAGAVMPDDALSDLLRHASAEGFPAPLAVISPEALAVIFELFLADRISVVEGYRVKKAAKSAVLYTGSVNVPDPDVVQALISSTLPAAMRDVPGRPVRILDPACGAGIFLLAAYRFLAGRGIDPGTILNQSIHGTDIDPESVSAARLVLLLAFMADSRKTVTGHTGAEVIRRVSGDLVRLIRCGNALIAPDYFSGRQVHPFNTEERRRVNAFSWQDAFSEIIISGGFDAVIGAPPPYRPFAIRTREEYFQTHYESYAEGAGLYTFFTERALSLVRPGGRIAVLVPAQFLRTDTARQFRRFLLTHRILQITDTGRNRLLQDGEARMYILSLSNEPPSGTFPVVRMVSGTGKADAGDTTSRELLIDQRSLTDGGWTLTDRRVAEITKRLRRCGMPLDHYVMGDIRSGAGLNVPKIIIPEYCHVPIFIFDRIGSYASGESIIAIERDDPYLAGILNSSLARFLIATLCPRNDLGYHISPGCLGKLPVITPDFDRLAEKTRYDKIVALVTQRSSLNDYQQRAKTDQERRLVQQEIDATDVKIDALVYELYGLTAEEIAVVEESAGK